MSYLWVLVVLLAIYFAVLFTMKYFLKHRITNFVFFFVTYACYLASVLIIFLDVGANDWNFLNTLPVANISPFLFFCAPLFYILPKKVKGYFVTLISLLSVGMLFSVVLNCCFNIFRNYAFHPHFLLDYFAHISLSLWGIYFVKSKQIEFKKRDCLIASAIIISVAIIMMILNIIFDTAFFGLSLGEKYNIYNMVLVNSPYLSALIYFAGLIIVLFIGFVCNGLIKKIDKRRENT